MRELAWHICAFLFAASLALLIGKTLITAETTLNFTDQGQMYLSWYVTGVIGGLMGFFLSVIKYFFSMKKSDYQTKAAWQGLFSIPALLALWIIPVANLADWVTMIFSFFFILIASSIWQWEYKRGLEIINS